MKDWYLRAKERAYELKISHEAVADIIGRGRSTVSGWLSGEREPKLFEISMLANCLGVSEQWLLFGSKYENHAPPSSKYTNEIQVNVWNKNIKTNELITIPASLGLNTRAYILTQDTACDIAHEGTRIVVNPHIEAHNNDYIFANINNDLSVYRLLKIAGKEYIGVDDQRVPLLEIFNHDDVLGVVVFASRTIRA